MPVPLLPLLHSGSSSTNTGNKNKNKSTTRAVLLKWVAVLVFIYAFLRWMQFFGPLSDTISTEAAPEVHDEEGEAANIPQPDTIPSTEGPTELDSSASVVASAGIKRHTDRVAVIIEDRPLGNLVPVILHFHAVLGPEWPIILYTSPSTHQSIIESSVAFSRATTIATTTSTSTTLSPPVIEIRHLPPNTTFTTHASVSEFLTSPYLWTDLAPYVKILLFQADSIICASSPSHADDFIHYDLIGAPIDARYGVGYNGGLSIRNRELMLRVLERWDFSGDTAATEGTGMPFEDQWFYTRMKALADDAEIAGELGVVVELPDQETAARFAVETVWAADGDGITRPLGFHQPQRWQKDNMGSIMEYCPEVGMIAGSTFFG